MATSSLTAATFKKARAGRRWAFVFVSIYLLVQIWFPLRYYIGMAEDERFAWRMFSSIKMADRIVTVNEVMEDGTTKRLLPFSWTSPLGQLPRLDRRFLEWRGEQPGVTGVHVEIRITAVNGEVLPVETMQWPGDASTSDE